MPRLGTFAALLVFFLVVAGCHRKVAPAPAPPPAPVAAPSTATPAQTTPSPKPRHATPQPPVTPREPARNADAPAPAFRLGEALTPEEVRAHNAEIDRRLQHARQALAAIARSSISRQQKATVAQIRDFIAQAEEMRQTNVAGARSLAERADVLATDLLSSLK